MNEHWSGCDTVVPHYAARSRRKARVDWSPSDRKILADLWIQKKPKLTAEQIGEIIGGRTKEQVYAKVAQMGLPGRNKGQRSMRDKADAFDFTVKRSSVQHGGSQRRFQGASARQKAHITLKPHDPRYRAGTTVFPTTVRPAAAMTRLLKSGVHSRKIGAVLEKGRWKGQHIYTLTLEERATCPRSCKEWATCYGNNMHQADRIYDDGTLTRRLWGELAALSAENPAGFVVRLHVLGGFFGDCDFYTPTRLTSIDEDGAAEKGDPQQCVEGHEYPEGKWILRPNGRVASLPPNLAGSDAAKHKRSV